MKAAREIAAEPKLFPSSAGYPKNGDEFVGFGFIGVVDKVIDERVHYHMRPMGRGSMPLAAYAKTSKINKG